MDINELRIQKKKYLHNEEDFNFKIEFELVNTSVAFINCLRRICSSLTPVVTFDDTYYSDTSLNSIKVIKNTSSLHNEFLSQRISLLPINMEINSHLNIETTYVPNDEKRIWKFSNLETVPLFRLNIKNLNNSQSTSNKSIVDVTTNDFTVESNNETLDVRNFFPADINTQEYILINKLKSNLIDTLEVTINLS